MGRTPKVKYFCKKCKDRNVVISCACGICDKIIFKRGSDGRLRTYAKNHHHTILCTGPNNWKWKEGSIKNTGYKVTTTIRRGIDKEGRRKKYTGYHRRVYEEYYNCCLLSYTDIHHKDENKLNNNISNLEPIYHGSRHNILHKKKK